MSHLLNVWHVEKSLETSFGSHSTCLLMRRCCEPRRREQRTYDLRTGETVTFSQVYPGLCNPALGNYETCLLYESYTTGLDGLSGSVHIEMNDNVVTGSVSIDWQGYTDRFGSPVQWHQHGTSGHYTANLVRLQ